MSEPRPPVRSHRAPRTRGRIYPRLFARALRILISPPAVGLLGGVLLVAAVWMWALGVGSQSVPLQVLGGSMAPVSILLIGIWLGGGMYGGGRGG